MRAEERYNLEEGPGGNGCWQRVSRFASILVGVAFDPHRPSSVSFKLTFLMEYTEYIPEDEVIAAQAADQAREDAKQRLLVDSLPYIDSYDDAAQNAAQLLIQQEMARFPNTHKPETVTVTFEVRFLFCIFCYWDLGKPTS